MRYLVGVLIGAWLMGGAVQAETLRVAYFEQGDVPFVIRDGSKGKGIFPDLMAAIARVNGDTLSVRFLPNARIQGEFDQGLLDLEVGANPAWRKEAKVPGLYSISFGLARTVLCYRLGVHRTKDQVEDFAGERIGTIAGYHYPEFEAAFNSHLVSRENVDNPRNLLLMLNAKRFKQVFVSKQVKDYWQAQDRASYGCLEGRTVDQAEMMIRVHPARSNILPKLNAAIESLRKSGELDAIFRRYAS